MAALTPQLDYTNGPKVQSYVGPNGEIINLDAPTNRWYSRGPAVDNGGAAGNEYGTNVTYWNPETGEQTGNEWQKLERSSGFIGDNLDIIGPLAVAGFAGWGAGLFGGTVGSSASTAATTAAGGTAVREGATLLEVLQAAAASEPGLAATLTEAGLYGSEAVNAQLIASIESNPNILTQVGE